MAIKIEQTHEKEIIALDNFTAIRHRSNMYVGQVALKEENLPLVIDNKIIKTNKTWSVGLLQLFIEIFENALDEAKRCKGKMKTINVSINTDTNEITISDLGFGFYEAAKIHKKTKKNVVRTALEDLHAGSNFSNSDNNIIGSYGLGSAIVNILSKKFEVTTINKTDFVNIIWDDYKIIKETIRKKKSNEEMGTSISFIPSTDIFFDNKWDLQILTSYLSLKSFLIKQDDVISKLDINTSYIKNNEEFKIELFNNFIPKDHFEIKTKMGNLYFYQSYDNSDSISFINGSRCEGIHQKIINDWINEYFNYNLAHHFYETIFVLNVPSELKVFEDQNKTRYAVSRNDIYELLESNFKSKLINSLKNSDISKCIEKEIENRLYEENIKKIRKVQKLSKRKISDKYNPSCKDQVNIWLCEGNCLEENTKIFIIRRNKILFEKIKNVRIDDLVITHKNSLQKVNYLTKSIKKVVKIKTNIGNIECSENHKWFVYDKEKNSFYFLETKNIDKSKHQLVKNYLVFLDSFEEIKEVDYSNDKIKIMLEKNIEWYFSKNDKVCVFDMKANTFVMKKVDNLIKGDILTKISIN